MGLLRFIKYDINEGILRFWKRYLLVVLLELIVCVMFDQETGYCLELYNEGWSPLEYTINEFWGRLPYCFNPEVKESFTVPFAWILEYLLLAYCIGSYISEDMRGFGVQLMIKSKKRILWWSSKCIWCILVNVFYFVLLWGVNIGYVWIMTGDINNAKNETLLTYYYGNLVASTSMKELVMMAIVFPFLVGVVQSLFQIIFSINMNSVSFMTILSVILVFSSYYANPLLIHGYAMVTRYYPDGVNMDYKSLDIRFGLIYLIIIIFMLLCGGYFVIRKKNILVNSLTLNFH